MYITNDAHKKIDGSIKIYKNKRKSFTFKRTTCSLLHFVKKLDVFISLDWYKTKPFVSSIQTVHDV